MNNKVLFVAISESSISYSTVRANEIEAFKKGADIIRDSMRDPPLLFQYPGYANYINAILDEEWKETDEYESIKKLMAEIDDQLPS